MAEYYWTPKNKKNLQQFHFNPIFSYTKAETQCYKPVNFRFMKNFIIKLHKHN